MYGPVGCGIHQSTMSPKILMGRNTLILKEIVETISPQLSLKEYALRQLEDHFHDRLLVDVGNVFTIGEYAEQLRLNITEDERSVVLDYIAEKQMVLITIDVVENAINELLGWDRFMEP